MIVRIDTRALERALRRKLDQDAQATIAIRGEKRQVAEVLESIQSDRGFAQEVLKEIVGVAVDSLRFR